MGQMIMCHSSSVIKLLSHTQIGDLPCRISKQKFLNCGARRYRMQDARFEKKSIGHGCSNHSNLEMEAECMTKTLSYLNLPRFRSICEAPSMQIFVFLQPTQLFSRLFKSFIFENGSRMSDENLVILEFMYLQNKKW